MCHSRLLKQYQLNNFLCKVFSLKIQISHTPKTGMAATQAFAFATAVAARAINNTATLHITPQHMTVDEIVAAILTNLTHV
eukprot:m.43056 g.43056  ORF g.43056 m.43056 type:complete len:81 (-) comp19287_c0_seq2:124-366(-)